MGHAPPKILIVDDDPAVRDILSRWIEKEGYVTRMAGNAEEGWERLTAEPDCSLVLSDIMLPGQSGIEFLARVRESRPDVAVIMVTGVDERDVAVRALEIGAYGYIIKPFERNELYINVVNALARRRLVLAAQEYERGLEEQVRAQTEEIRSSREEIALRLVAAQGYRHDETGAHIRRVGLCAETVAQRLAEDDGFPALMRLAAPMHDVGKIGIPDSILLKPGRLTPEEERVMRTHTTIGARILEGSSIEFVQTAHEVALGHHEKWSGGGYPAGLAGEAIPRSARIVSVVDVYDALCSDRVYRRALSEEEALTIMHEGRGKQFDPDIFDAFTDALPAVRAIRDRYSD